MFNSQKPLAGDFKTWSKPEIKLNDDNVFFPGRLMNQVNEQNQFKMLVVSKN